MGSGLSLTQLPLARVSAKGPAHLLGGEFPARLIHILDLNIGLVAVLLLEVLGEASVLLPPAVLVIDGPEARQRGSVRTTGHPLPVLPEGPRPCAPTYILSSMQYTAEGRDLLGAFTRATFCTVVSSSPGDRDAMRLQTAHAFDRPSSEAA